MIRIIIKETHQPPIDTPASISYKTVDIDCPALERALHGDIYSRFQVIGQELLNDPR